MKITFYEYPTCSTCRNAKKYLISHDFTLEIHHIVDETPSFEELKQWCHDYHFDPNKLFNTNGTVFKELKLKEKLAFLSEDEKFTLLSSNGMLIKRPLLILDDRMLVGFREAMYKEALLK